MRTIDLVTWVANLGTGGRLVPNDKQSVSTDKQRHALILSLVHVPDTNGEPTMQKLNSLESEEAKQAEIDRIRTVLEKFNKVLEVSKGVLEDMIQGLREASGKFP